MNYKYLIALLIAAAASFYLGQSTKSVEYVEVTKTVIDTTYVSVEKIVYKQLPAVHDTVEKHLVTVFTDTVYQVEASHITKELESDSVKYGIVSVDYYPRPFDWFNIDFQPAPLPIITITKFINQDRKFYEKPWFGLATMAFSGFVMYYAGKDSR